ncbi:uncharacterized protein [Procambarus clarkii]|uniref:uncharacterized protein n=1 Tax=Procambarus clarkii TaxID=6728 RepID=UPI003743FA94
MWVYLVVLWASATSRSLCLPEVEVQAVAGKDLRTMNFIEQSYQPLLIRGALRREVVKSLRPWTFPALCSSLEAASTFAVAFPKHGEEKEDQRDSQEGQMKDANLGYFSEDGVPMSLRRFCVEGEGQWEHARSSITKDIGSAVVLPRFLHDADFSFIDLTKTGLHHRRAGSEGQEPGPGARDSAIVVCVVEGRLSLTLTPSSLPCRLLQCLEEEEGCQTPTPPPGDDAPTNDPTQSLLVRASVEPRACLYNPPGWQWCAVASADTTYLWLTWKEDLVIQEHVIDRLFQTDEQEESSSEAGGNTETSAGLHKREKRDSQKGRRRRTPLTLWEALPRSLERPLLLWGARNPLLHLLRRYLLSDHSLHLQAFLDQFRIDRTLLPQLVDCPKECLSVGQAVFTLLDTDTDGVLTARDANLLTQDTFNSLTHHLDSLVDELNDLAREQWTDVLEGEPESRQAFLDRAKDRLAASAAASVKRWVAGDLEGVDEEALKEHLPDLHAQVLAAREASPSTASSEKEEL